MPAGESLNGKLATVTKKVHRSLCKVSQIKNSSGYTYRYPTKAFSSLRNNCFPIRRSNF